MDTSFGRNVFSGQPAASNRKPHGSIPARFLDNDYLIGLGLALQKKRGDEYLTGSGNTVQRKIGNQPQRVTLQYTNRSFYFSSICDGVIHVFDYLPQDERMAHFNEYAHVGKRFATIKKPQICEVHRIIDETNATNAIDLLLADCPGNLTMLHPLKTNKWFNKDRIEWYARQGGRHYRIHTSNTGAALHQWADNQILLRLTPEQITLHSQIRLHRKDEEN
ncbi:hypothetical protein [Pseudovibrio sp. JE062]|uniref:hypothetical protein n=1 Tax=Pseudovibrio sp. JE062 TaxID=439495 RepID=UPI000186BFDA|nr:hypothetical protein [Pseudovibrio sp. JE062]EEA91869.1 hypothetical protein PJE062_2416 [Pseudovibrio sp. JE062]